MAAPRSTAWEYVADRCRENPRTPHLVGRNMNQAYVSQIKQGRLAAFRPAGSFDAFIREGDGRTGTLFVTAL